MSVELSRSLRHPFGSPRPRADCTHVTPRPDCRDIKARLRREQSCSVGVFISLSAWLAAQQAALSRDASRKRTRVVCREGTESCPSPRRTRRARRRALVWSRASLDRCSYGSSTPHTTRLARHPAENGKAVADSFCCFGRRSAHGGAHSVDDSPCIRRQRRQIAPNLRRILLPGSFGSRRHYA